MPRKLKTKRSRIESVSRTLLEFSRPLLELYRPDEPPPTREAMEEILRIATTIWNAFVLDAWHGGGANASEVELIMALPPPISNAAKQMKLDRVHRFGEISWAIGDVQVVDDGRGGFSIRAEARAEVH